MSRAGLIAQAFADRREAREEYERELYVRYERAEEACRGAMLNARGRAKGIDPISLFMGNRARAYAYASAELVEHWESYPRMTVAEHERRWMAEREAEMIGAAAA